MESVFPDVKTLAGPPDRETARQWINCWRAVTFVYRRQWRFGVVKVQVQQADGTWVLLIEHASDDLVGEPAALVWVVNETRLIHGLVSARNRTSAT